MNHHFTVDVEEYFQVHALEPYVPRADWDRLPGRVERATRLLLELLAEHGSAGTFFVLGWIAERHPALVRDIAAAGHEVASHGWGHERVDALTPAQFRESVRTSKAVLEDAAGAPVWGYRAPSFSISPERAWAFDVLLEEGYAYDSSVFPGRGHGWPAAARDPHRVERAAGVLHELPPATLRAGGRLFPAGGGAFLRLLPRALVTGALRQAERRGVPGTFYVHPWELDPEQPRIRVDLKTRMRHYGGLKRTVPRIRRLLAGFRFQPIARTLALESAPAEAPCPA
ncbi:XrtA system polysaccharide deacetylase [Longimicrobium sp.]|uniref:XrtA system polysaccharide deacetylase n=1 Tax=Longimicrobium sp. TaxID=2029185 RepID=UPI002C2ECCB0|nr:XrtA system polysaccharide deacetylase [Longimicrobium sp.]HSU13301.1 XrtA system polysaccharide deacetylase [Longimicrobium sp.]